MSSLLQIGDATVKVELYDKEFVLLKKTNEVDSLSAIAKLIFDQRYNFVEEVIGTETEILLKLNEHYSADSLSQLADLKVKADLEPTTYQLPITFSEKGDWESIEKTTGISRVAYQAQLLNQTYTLAMLGFLPGFLYLNGLPSKMAVPRKTNPARKVPAGSLAVGAHYLGFYSLPSPGGWNIIAHSPIKILDLDSLPPVTLNPSDKIKLQIISLSTHQALLNNPLTLTEYNELL